MTFTVTLGWSWFAFAVGILTGGALLVGLGAWFDHRRRTKSSQVRYGASEPGRGV